MSEPDSLEVFFNSLPDEIDIRVRIDKNVWKQMYKATQKDDQGVVDERHVLNDWIIGTIRYTQRGVKFFYEAEAKEGIPSVRFLDDEGNVIPKNKMIYKPYPKENTNEDSTAN